MRLPPVLRSLLRVLALVCAWALLAGTAAPVRAADDDEPAADACRCAEANACWHFLNAPVSAPDVPCNCPKCGDKHRHDGRTTPPGWNPACFATKSMDCFLKRHAASWRLTCSACLANDRCCNQPHPERCPACQDGDAKSPWPRDAEKTSAERLAIERKVFTKGEPIVVESRHFHVVTDIQRIKMHTQDGGFRVATGHEYAHVLAMRAEQAYREFRAAFGTPSVGRGVGIFVPQRESTARELQGVYFRNPRAHMIFASYGGSSESAISEGWCLCGFCISSERFGDDDLKLHQALRHLLGNIFLTNWIVTSGEARNTPPWAFEGLAHWLGRRPDFLADEVYYCEGEENKVSGSGKGWMTSVAAAAAKGTLRPIDEILATRALGKLEQRDVQQAWAWFQVAMEDCPKQWAALQGEIRRETDVHEAFRKTLGFSAEEFQARFIARVTGARKSLLDGATPAAGPAPAPGTDARAVAAKLRASPPPTDEAGVAALLDVASRADAIREAAYTLLLQVKTPAAREAIWKDGLRSPEPMVRAYAARLCRKLKIAEAKDALRKAMDDPSWLVRAEAALADMAIADGGNQGRVRDMLQDPSPKVRIGASDALVVLGRDLANPLCVPALLQNLAHADWQVRVATCQALAVLGDVRAVGPLIDRMAVDGGRVAEECRLALKAITYDDLGPSADNWRKWWERAAGDARDHGFTKREARPGDERYESDAPKAYGIELTTWRLGFVVDTSRSTHRAFTPDEATAKRLLGGRTQSSISEIVRGQVEEALTGKDARIRFNVWTFGTLVSDWNRGLVPATAANVESAVGFLAARTPAGETNFHLALRCVLDVRDGDDYLASFRDTPDTILVLTDGTPTDGDITDPEVLLRWFTELNRYARVRVHTVAFGALDVDERFLGRLAAQNWGVFEQVRESNPR